MPRRNLIVLFAAALISLVCYHLATRNRYVTTFGEAMNLVATEYIDDVEPRLLFEGAMDGMMDQLDPYSGYVAPREFQQFQETMDGEFEGVGIVVEADAQTGNLKVLDALIGKPGYRAGIRTGDLILAIDGRAIKGLSLRESVAMIRGQPGTAVKMLVRHAGGGEPREYTLERTRIPLESVLGDARRNDGTWIFRFVEYPRLGYLRIVNFGERTSDELRKALRTYRHPGEEIEGLVIDLRGNAGGLLKSAVETCDLFLDEGLVVSTQGRGKLERERFEAHTGTELSDDVPIVVLVDKLSASASEIVAACLQDHERATIAGQRSWGKGTVQNVHYLAVEGEQSALRLTVGRYLRPSGIEIHKRKDAKDSDPWGVRPLAELEVHPTNEQYDTLLFARRERDRLTWDELAKARQNPPAEASDEPEAPPQPVAVIDDGAEPGELPTGAGPVVPTVPTPIPEADTSSEPSPEEAAEVNAIKDPSSIDPQLNKAIDFLKRQIARRREATGQA
jgi:carboxyl-terminal processing protease